MSASAESLSFACARSPSETMPIGLPSSTTGSRRTFACSIFLVASSIESSGLSVSRSVVQASRTLASGPLPFASTRTTMSRSVTIPWTVFGSSVIRSRMVSAIVPPLIATRALPEVAHLTHWLARGKAAPDPHAVPAGQPLPDPAARGPHRRAAAERVQVPRRREGDFGRASRRALRLGSLPQVLQRGARGVPPARAPDAAPDDEGGARPGGAPSGRVARGDGEARPGAAQQPPADVAAADGPDRAAAQLEPSHTRARNR